MKKLKLRSIPIFMLILLIIAGMGLFSFRLAGDGAKWASSRVNGNVYASGRLTRGEIFSREGELLIEYSAGGPQYSEDPEVRKATVHLIGDKNGNVGGGVSAIYREDLIGYSLAEGVASGGKLSLSVSSELSKAALRALDGRNGAVGVVNYKTGEILCMVSAPAFDPEGDGTDVEDGAYINRLTGAAFTPGSVFKLVTMAAAIDNIPDLYGRSFTCSGEAEIGGTRIACTHAHGDMKIEDALARSCNCVFASLSYELGAEIMSRYAEGLGITQSFDIDGIGTAKGSYDGSGELLPWSGAGQGKDLAVPASLLRLVSAVANEGFAQDFTFLCGGSGGSTRLLSADTAQKLKSAMSYSVYLTYGRENFPGLSLAAKSGTAEVGGGKAPNAWFVGFSTDESFPVAFAVLIENGGSGTLEAGKAANELLQEAKKLF
ncbi:MAG: penicillin-binding protein [Oscillospiraceae bacterium]|nr:penicillin-binding protein [Oscillospiraceae bacterium]